MAEGPGSAAARALAAVARAGGQAEAAEAAEVEAAFARLLAAAPPPTLGSRAEAGAEAGEGLREEEEVVQGAAAVRGEAPVGRPRGEHGVVEAVWW